LYQRFPVQPGNPSLLGRRPIALRPPLSRGLPTIILTAKIYETISINSLKKDFFLLYLTFIARLISIDFDTSISKKRCVTASSFNVKLSLPEIINIIKLLMAD
jgi:hypothetical protein